MNKYREFPCDTVTLFSGWESAVNIYEAESINTGGVTLKTR